MIIDDYRGYRWDFDDFSQMNEAKILRERAWLHAWLHPLVIQSQEDRRKNMTIAFFWLVVLNIFYFP